MVRDLVPNHVPAEAWPFFFFFLLGFVPPEAKQSLSNLGCTIGFRRRIRVLCVADRGPGAQGVRAP